MYENEIENIVSRSSDEEIYYGLLEFTKNMAQQRGKIEGKKKLYYISAEFLIGKLLSNNLINLGLYDQVAKALEKHGKSMTQIEEIEQPSEEELAEDEKNAQAAEANEVIEETAEPDDEEE